MEVELWQLRYVVAVAEERNVTRAAARLHMSQPALSTRIRELEERLGFPLFVRRPRSVDPTPAGEELVRRGRALLADAQLAVGAARNAAAGEAPQLVVGLMGTAGSTLFGRVAELVRAELPGATLTPRRLLGATEIDAGAAEVAFCRFEPDETALELLPLLRERRVLALAADHRLAAVGELELADLRGEAFFTQPSDNNRVYRERWLAEQRRGGLDGTIAQEISDAEELLTLLAAGRGVCLVPASAARYFARPGLAYVRVRDADSVAVALAWRAAAEQPLVRAVRDASRSAAAELLAAPGQSDWLAPDGHVSSTTPIVSSQSDHTT